MEFSYGICQIIENKTITEKRRRGDSKKEGDRYEKDGENDNISKIRGTALGQKRTGRVEPNLLQILRDLPCSP